MAGSRRSDAHLFTAGSTYTHGRHFWTKNGGWYSQPPLLDQGGGRYCQPPLDVHIRPFSGSGGAGPPSTEPMAASGVAM